MANMENGEIMKIAMEKNKQKTFAPHGSCVGTVLSVIGLL